MRVHRLAAQLMVGVAHHEAGGPVQLLAVDQSGAQARGDDLVRVGRDIGADHELHALGQPSVVAGDSGVGERTGGRGGVHPDGGALQTEPVGGEVGGQCGLDDAASRIRQVLLHQVQWEEDARIGEEQFIGTGVGACLGGDGPEVGEGVGGQFQALGVAVVGGDAAQPRVDDRHRLATGGGHRVDDALGDRHGDFAGTPRVASTAAVAALRCRPVGGPLGTTVFLDDETPGHGGVVADDGAAVEQAEQERGDGREARGLAEVGLGVAVEVPRAGVLAGVDLLDDARELGRVAIGGCAGAACEIAAVAAGGAVAGEADGVALGVVEHGGDGDQT